MRWARQRARAAAGALLPHSRIVAYYGNPMSKRMGILGQIAPDSMLARLQGEVRAVRGGRHRDASGAGVWS